MRQFDKYQTTILEGQSNFRHKDEPRKELGYMRLNIQTLGET